MEELTAIHKRQYEVELLGRLEGELERDDEGIVDLGKYGSFCECMCDLRTRDDVSFANSLERVDPMRVSFPNRSVSLTTWTALSLAARMLRT